MKRFALAIACALLAACSLPATARMEVTVTGAVTHPGTLSLKDDARLSAAALAAGVQHDAYLLGAAWLRPQNRRPQVRLKAGIEYDLNALHHRALLRGNAQASAALLALHDWIASLPVTGREPALLAPRVVEATPAQNHPLAPGDVLYYPPRPRSIRVVGAVVHACRMAFRPLADARAYLAGCRGGMLADRDWVWVIQPDGHVSKRGIAAWNRSAPGPLAPGAVIYMPVTQQAADAVDGGMNRDIAHFLATQVLPGPGAPR
jgi:protein involved in polysaccharide export with SLBB domain